MHFISFNPECNQVLSRLNNNPDKYKLYKAPTQFKPKK
jgi:hypothetical protein